MCACTNILYVSCLYVCPACVLYLCVCVCVGGCAPGPDSAPEGRGPVFPGDPGPDRPSHPADQGQGHADGGPLHGGDSQL